MLAQNLANMAMNFGGSFQGEGGERSWFSEIWAQVSLESGMALRRLWRSVC